MKIQFTIGTVNFSDFLHITATRVRDNALVWENWYDTPVTSLVVEALGLDADQYYIRLYDAPDDESLGTLYAECSISGLSPLYQYELRFYTIGNLPGTASLSVDGKTLTDTYLIGKNVFAYEKTAYGKFDPSDEYTFEQSTGELEIINGTALSDGEKVCVIILNNVAAAQVSENPAGFYNDTLTITAASLTLINTDKNKRVRLKGTGTKQVITLPALSSISNGDGFYFDNSVNGVPVCPKFLCNGTDRIKFGGFSAVLNSLSEIWLTAGEYMLIKKNAADDVWEIELTNMNTHTGASFYHYNNIIPFAMWGNGREAQVAADGDAFGRLWYWINNLLSPSSYINDVNVNSASYVHPAGQEYKWVKHPTLKLFRPPNTQSNAPVGKYDMYFI
jgi:hypothetical protein